MSLNRVVIMGRLTRDPELRRTQTGTAVTSFSLAVDRDFKSRESGEKATDFIDVVAWRQTAEFVCQYFAKGRMAVVEGRLQIRDWKDKDGNNRRSAEVVADNVYFGDSKRDGASGGDYAPPAYGSPASTYSAPAGGGFAEIDEDGELPFLQNLERRILPWLWNAKTRPLAPVLLRTASAARSASSALTSASISTIRTPPSCAASFPSAPRSCPAGPPAPVPCISVS